MRKLTAIASVFSAARNLSLVFCFWMSKPSFFGSRRHSHSPALGYNDFRPFSFLPAMLCFRLSLNSLKGAPLMEWVTPQHEEIDLNCEISSYANAEL
jgi:hypothetical protein